MTFIKKIIISQIIVFILLSTMVIGTENQHEQKINVSSDKINSKYQSRGLIKLKADLSSANHFVRLEAIKNIGEIGSCDANVCKDILDMFFIYKDDETQREIRSTLLKIGNKSVPIIFQYIIHERPVDKDWSNELGRIVYDTSFITKFEYILVEMGDQSLPYLLNQINNKNDDFRKEAAKIVGMMGEENLTIIKEMLYSNDIDKKIFAIRSLEVLSASKTKEIVTMKLYVKNFVFSQNSELSKVAFDAIIHDNSINKMDIIDNLLYNKDEYIRLNTIVSLYINNYKSESITNTLMKFVQDRNESEDIRFESLRVLNSLINDPQLIIKLSIPILHENKNRKLKILVCELIAENGISSLSINNALENLKNTDDKELREKVLETLKAVNSGNRKNDK
jgi:hypothetical protein